MTRAPTAIIAEDEPLLRGELQDALAITWPELQLLAVVEDGHAAVAALEHRAPDVLFLDIEMPGRTGLEVARVASGRCHIVFVTAYDHYAVKAFEEGAIDYVMKPFTPARLAAAVNRTKERLRGLPADLDGLLHKLVEHAAARKPYLKWISVAQGQNMQLITVDEICYFQADNKYTLVATATSQPLVRKPIRELIDELDPDVFWQIHRSTVVNVNAIASIHRDRRGYLQVRLKARPETLAVSAQYAHLFRQL